MKNLIPIFISVILSTNSFAEVCSPVHKLIDTSFLQTSKELAKSCHSDDISEEIQTKNCQCIQNNPTSFPLSCQETKELEKSFKVKQKKIRKYRIFVVCYR